MRHFFNIIPGDDTCCILLYGDIGDSYGTVSSGQIARELLAAEAAYKSIDVRINSNGGEVYTGIAIFNALRNSKADIRIFVDGIAASMASVIALCGKPVQMSKYARLMLHSVSGGCYWNPSQSCSTVYRGTSLPADRSQSQYRGFRLAIGDPIITSTSFSVDGVEFKMVEVEGGTFEMGATPEQENPQDVEKPVHNVTLSTYSIGQTEVTQALWTAVMGTNPSYYKANNLPVESVTYDDCKAFVTALNTKLAAQLPKGKVFRLPTEAEWEFAARGGVWSQGYQYSGSNTIDDVAWYNGNCEKTHSVAQKQANELGIYDMSGNVREWCFDWISGYSGLDQTNPTGSGTGGTYPARVVRGGSWNHDASYCRTACRGLGSEWSSSIGLRLVIGDPLVTPTVYKVGDVEFAMIDVEAGTFQMGSSTGGSDERPVHEVTLSSYAIGETEVTQALWKAVGMGKNPSAFISSDYLPVENVSWDDCQEFVNRLNTKLAGQLPKGKVFRLPTEAEWEFAARGGNKSQGYQYSGSNNLDDVAWYSGNSGSKTHVVQGKWVNELGLYDMSGNVWEWCQDWYGAYRSSAQTNPIGPASGDQKVIRGGCWANPSNYCCNSSRGRQLPANAYNFLGFRLVIGDPVISAVYNVGGVEFKMVEVEGGTFQMGSATGESNEQPVHEVTLSSYFIAEKEVTQALWSSVMDYNPSEVKGMNLPVTNVTWNDCQSFITKLNQKIGNGKKFRLPTEAEWEFAARGGVWSQGYQYSGSNTIDDVAWYNGNSGGKAQSVRQKQANELGLYDMTGNVWEWCQDWYGDYTSSAQTNPNGPASGTERVLRGASWYNYTRYCRTTYRHKNAPTNVSSDFGFRLAM